MRKFLLCLIAGAAFAVFPSAALADHTPKTEDYEICDAQDDWNIEIDKPPCKLALATYKAVNKFAVAQDADITELTNFSIKFTYKKVKYTGRCKFTEPNTDENDAESQVSCLIKSVKPKKRYQVFLWQ